MPGRGFGCTGNVASSPARQRVLSAVERSHPLTPWAVMGGCVSVFSPESGRSNGSLLLGDCFFSPEGCDVVLGCAVCPPSFHRGGGQIWMTGGARELLGTLTPTLEEVGAETRVQSGSPFGMVAAPTRCVWPRLSQCAFCIRKKGYRQVHRAT